MLERDIHLNKFKFKSYGGINEYLYSFEPKKQLEVLNTMNLHWSSSEIAITDNTYMLFHLDRKDNDESYTKYQKWYIMLYWRLKAFVKDLIFK